ncbi:MAG TPA: hypothetical protein OIM43_07475 [Prevotellaceae bacterium]|nr:hypothetical protein [Prevotellaceae bacterium]
MENKYVIGGRVYVMSHAVILPVSCRAGNGVVRSGLQKLGIKMLEACGYEHGRRLCIRLHE